MFASVSGSHKRLVLFTSKRQVVSADPDKNTHGVPVFPVVDLINILDTENVSALISVGQYEEESFKCLILAILQERVKKVELSRLAVQINLENQFHFPDLTTGIPLGEWRVCL